MIELNRIYNEDCLEGMKRIPDKSVDCIVCDLPYGTTGLKWDKCMNLVALWEQYRRIIKDCHAVVLFAQQPFTTRLIASCMDWWKYNWVWAKPQGTNFANANYCPLKVTEDICVFSNGRMAYHPGGGAVVYNPQFTQGKPYVCVNGNRKGADCASVNTKSSICGHKTVNGGRRYPRNLLYFNRDKNKLHPTQKPVALIEYLIRTYTNEGDTVLDNCMGSGTTAVACINTGRNYIGFELDKGYCDLAEKRISEHKKTLL